MFEALDQFVSGQVTEGLWSRSSVFVAMTFGIVLLAMLLLAAVL